jgi:ribose-phosphate pyrophosphokinase
MGYEPIMEEVIIGGSSAQVFALKLAKESGIPLLKLDLRKFPDGERYIRVLGDVEGKTVDVVQSMYMQPDDFLFEYFLLVDNLRDIGASKIRGIIPYFAYARQDGRFNPGEAFSLKTVCKTIESVGTTEVYTIDLHLHRIESISSLFKIPSTNLTVVPDLARYIKKNVTMKNPAVIGPDEEAEQWAKVAAKELGADYDVLEKHRVTSDEKGKFGEVDIKPRELSMKGRDVLIIDDIISTGGTIVQAIGVLKKNGVNKVYVATSHPVLVENALMRVLEAGAEMVIGSDTIPSPVSLVSAAPTVAKVIKR